MKVNAKIQYAVVAMLAIAAYVSGAGLAHAGLPVGCSYSECASHAGNNCYLHDIYEGSVTVQTFSFTEDERCAWTCSDGTGGALDCSGF